jgi:hypothetical protein
VPSGEELVRFRIDALRWLLLIAVIVLVVSVAVGRRAEDEDRAA